MQLPRRDVGYSLYDLDQQIHLLLQKLHIYIKGTHPFFHNIAERIPSRFEIFSSCH